MQFIIVGLLVIFIAVEVWIVRALFKNNLSMRFVRVRSINDVSAAEIVATDHFKRVVAEQPWSNLHDQKSKYIGALEWVMNNVIKYAPNPSHNPDELLSAVEAGEGAVCSGMSILYRNVLAALGLQSREVSLQRNLLDAYDAHTTVEVFLDGKWVIMDPTFNVSFADNSGQLLSTQDMKAHILSGLNHNIKPVFYGEVLYPNRLGNYYMSYFSFCNNVFIVENLSSSLLAKIPPLRYWLGPKAYYEKLPLESDSHIIFANQIYLFSMLVFPTIIMLIVLVLLISIFEV